MGIELSSESAQVLVAFGVYLVGVALLGFFSHRYLSRGSFVKEYFLGNRGLGPWVLALTVAATAISGGTFMGFPSLIYTNGWIMALWIASYMVAPVTTMMLMGKRINQVSRLAGSVTVPDVLRDRFNSPLLGILASLFILVFMIVNLVAQFKGGANVMETALDLPAHKVELPLMSNPLNQGYVIGLAIFAITVVAYTTYGGYWAVTLTDVLLGLVMVSGVIVMAVLAVNAVPPVTVVETPAVLEGQAAPRRVQVELRGLAAATERLKQQDPRLVYGPGPGNYLPLGMAFSFFLMWSLISAGQPSGMVRLMSFKDSSSVRRATILVCFYFMATYLSLLVIFVCARAIFPTEYLRESGNEALGEPDRIMPVMARHLSKDLPGGPLLAGLLLAAPYAAIMSTVAAFLLMISSSLVRDLYQRVINPEVSERTLRVFSYLITAGVGAIVMVGALNPPNFLQYIIVFTGTGLGCSFLVPMLLTLYWRRATKAGVLASMLGGFLTVLVLYMLGWVDSGNQQVLANYREAARSAAQRGEPAPSRPVDAEELNARMAWLPGWGEQRHDPWDPVHLLGCNSVVWGLLMSLVLGVFVSLLGRPDPALVAKYFPGEA